MDKIDILKVALGQMSSGPDLAGNLAQAAAYHSQAAAAAAHLLLLPECATCQGPQDLVRAGARRVHDWTPLLAPLARQAGLTVVWGGIAERTADGTIYNSSLVFDGEGTLTAVYRKTHLFQIDLQRGPAVDEAQLYAHGEGRPVFIGVQGWRLGLSICYDLRFPELYRRLAGCDALINTAAFTRLTGRAHWELLCRARAVENQAFFLAAAQCGADPQHKISTWGHSLALDPWGEILLDMGEEPALQCVELKKARLEEIRARLPALANRRG